MASSIASHRSVASQLDRLAALYQKNLLTEEEFLEAKAQTLAETRPGSSMAEARLSNLDLEMSKMAPTRPGTAQSSLSRASSYALPSDRAKGFGRSKVKVLPGQTQAPPCNPKANMQLQTGPLSHNAWIALKSSRGPKTVPEAPKWGADCRGQDDGIASDHPGRWLKQSSAELMNYPNLQRQSTNKITEQKRHGTRVPQAMPTGTPLQSARAAKSTRAARPHSASS